MQVTVFGANGKVGRLVVLELLAKGHTVIAFVHGNAPFAVHEQLHIRQGDIRRQGDVHAALEGSQAVISTLGSWHTRTKDILSSGMRVIIPAMQQRGMRRIISLTGSGALAPGDQWGFVGRTGHVLMQWLAPKILKDAETHLQLLAASDLGWTVLRSPLMNNFGRRTYRIDFKLPNALATINRRAVARALVDQLDNVDYLRTAPHLHRR